MKHFKTDSAQYPDPGRCVGVCPYCTGTMIAGHAKRMPTKDHIKPKSRFPKPLRTIVVCCQCNFLKRDMTLTEWLFDLQTKNKEFQQAIEDNKDRIDNVSYLLRIGIEE